VAPNGEICYGLLTQVSSLAIVNHFFSVVEIPPCRFEFLLSNWPGPLRYSSQLGGF
jgi:hypothetical protein